MIKKVAKSVLVLAAFLVPLACALQLPPPGPVASAAKIPGQAPGITQSLLHWMLNETHNKLRQVNYIAETASKAVGNFDAGYYLKFIDLVGQLNPLATHLKVQEFDFLRRKLRTLNPIKQELSTVFGLWLQGRVDALVAQEQADIKKNRSMKNLPPSERWMKLFNEIKFFFKNISDKELMAQGTKLLTSRFPNGVYTQMALLRQFLLEKYLPPTPSQA